MSKGGVNGLFINFDEKLCNTSTSSTNKSISKPLGIENNVHMQRNQQCREKAGMEKCMERTDGERETETMKGGTNRSLNN